MSKIIRGYKFRIYPTEEQAKQLDRFILLFQEVYNWGLNKENKLFNDYKNGKSKYQFYSFYELRSLFRKERRENQEYFYFNNIPSTTASLALENVIKAFKRFFKGQNNHPIFKNKYSKKSFKTRHDRFKINNNGIKIEGIKDYISLGFDCGLNLNKVSNPVITKDNLGDYYISFSLEEESKCLEIQKSEGIGIDLGVRQTFALSTGEIYNYPKEKLDKLDRELKRLNKHITRDINRRLEEANYTKTSYEDIPKSKRAIKRELKRNKKNRKKFNIKNTFYHTITKQIVMRNPEYVCMETFLTRDIQNNKPYMSNKISQVSFYTITEIMKYKCEKYNIPFIQASRDFASTQICSNCGHQKKMYGYHTYKCPICGMVEDRDINAAINLKNYGYNSLNNIGIVYY